MSLFKRDSIEDLNRLQINNFDNIICFESECTVRKSHRLFARLTVRLFIVQIEINIYVYTCKRCWIRTIKQFHETASRQCLHKNLLVFRCIIIHAGPYPIQWIIHSVCLVVELWSCVHIIVMHYLLQSQERERKSSDLFPLSTSQKHIRMDSFIVPSFQHLKIGAHN